MGVMTTSGTPSAAAHRTAALSSTTPQSIGHGWNISCQWAERSAGAAAREISAAWRGSEDVFAHPYAAAFLTAL
jgi:hypothetical protein